MIFSRLNGPDRIEIGIWLLLFAVLYTYCMDVASNTVYFNNVG